MTSCATTFVAQLVAGQPIADSSSPCGGCPAPPAGDGGSGGGAPDGGFICANFDVLPVPTADNPYAPAGYMPPCTGICTEDACPPYLS